MILRGNINMSIGTWHHVQNSGQLGEFNVPNTFYLILFNIFMSDFIKEPTPLWLATKAFVVGIYGLTNDGFFDSEPVLRTQLRSMSLSILTSVSDVVNSLGTDYSIVPLRRTESSINRFWGLLQVSSELEALKEKDHKLIVDQLDDIKSQVGKLSVTYYKKKKENGGYSKKQHRK